MTYRGTTNRNDRGSAADRRRRREWLVAEFGDGVTVVCSTCPAVLTVETVTADRYPLAGCEGGRVAGVALQQEERLGRAFFANLDSHAAADLLRFARLDQR